MSCNSPSELLNSAVNVVCIRDKIDQILFSVCNLYESSNHYE